MSGSYIYRMPRQRLVLPHEPAQTYVRIMREQDERAEKKRQEILQEKERGA